MAKKKKSEIVDKPEEQVEDTQASQEPTVEEAEEPRIDDIQTLDKPSADDDSELKKLLKMADSTFGEGVIASVCDIIDVKKVSTRNLLLDILTNGGLPKGSVTLFAGEESGGKTMQTLLLASVFTSQKIPVLYIGVEGDFDKNWAIKLGNDEKYFYIARPADLETAINIAEVATKSKRFGLVIFDSVTAGVPKEALDKDAFSQQMALQARLNAKLCQKLTSALQPSNLRDPNAYNNTLVVLIAHIREKVGVMYGNPEIIPGGHALKHHASYIIKFRRGAVLKQGENIVGREMHIKVEKAKFSRPLVSGITELFFDPPRLNNAKVMITYAIQMGIIAKSGPYYTYKDVKSLGQKALLIDLKGKPGMLEEIKESLIKTFNK